MIPQAVWAHWGVLTVVEQQVCLDRCSARACAAESLLFTVHSLFSTSSMCTSTAQARRIWVSAAGASSDAFSAHGDHFSWQAQGKPRVLVLQSRLFVTGARDRRCLISKCSFRGRRSTLDMVVIVKELRFRDRCSES